MRNDASLLSHNNDDALSTSFSLPTLTFVGNVVSETLRLVK